MKRIIFLGLLVGVAGFANTTDWNDDFAEVPAICKHAAASGAVQAAEKVFNGQVECSIADEAKDIKETASGISVNVSCLGPKNDTSKYAYLVTVKLFKINNEYKGCRATSVKPVKFPGVTK